MNSISKVYSQDFDYEKQKKENSSIFREKYLKQNHPIHYQEIMNR